MNLAQFFLELGVLKRLPRAGWLRAGIQNPETVASHTFRVALIAWALAKLESAKRRAHGAEPDINKVIKLALLHDLEESRTGDLDMVAKRYHKNSKKEKAFRDILKNSNLSVEASLLVNELLAGKTLESKIVKDSDQLELFLQALEYETAGFKEAKKWKLAAERALKLNSSKNLIKEIEKQDLTWWYQ